jgi:hypothetical protein
MVDWSALQQLYVHVIIAGAMDSTFEHCRLVPSPELWMVWTAVAESQLLVIFPVERQLLMSQAYISAHSKSMALFVMQLVATARVHGPHPTGFW